MTRNEFLGLVVASPLAMLFGKKIHFDGKNMYLPVAYPDSNQFETIWIDKNVNGDYIHSACTDKCDVAYESLGMRILEIARRKGVITNGTLLSRTT